MVDLPRLPPGTYTVVWHVTSVDTHKTEGRFDFTVVP
jgi:copper resistance protein C